MGESKYNGKRVGNDFNVKCHTVHVRIGGVGVVTPIYCQIPYADDYIFTEMFYTCCLILYDENNDI